MANTRFGNFSELSQGKKPMTAEEAWVMLNELGLLGQEFIPGATSVRKLMEGKPKEAVEELQDWIPGNAAYQNFIRGKEQDWVRNALDAMIIAKPVAKGAKKAAEAIERMPKGGKEGFITVKKGDKVKDILQKVSDAGQPLSQAQEAKLREAIGNYNATMRGDRNAARKLIKFQGEAERDPALKQAYVGFLESKGDNTLGGIIIPDAAGHRGVTKPTNFDSWTPDERINYIKGRMEFHGGSLDDLAEPLYKEHPEYGVLTDNGLRIEDYHKALLDKKAEEEAARAARPITTTQVQELSTGIVPGQASVPQGGTRPTYDHSRQFMDTELKQVPGIDRTGMSYGDETDAFYDIYKAWRNNPGQEIEALEKLKKSKKPGIQTDPFYQAGTVGDENKRLWNKIEDLRSKGKSDTEIREILKDDLDKYQGSLERYKARQSANESHFDYDGATTNYINGLDTEKVRALKALGIDTPEYDQLERLGNFYRVFFPK